MILNYIDWLSERFADTHPKHKYVELSNDEIQEYSDDIAELIQTAYADLGGNSEFKDGKALLKSDITFWIAADIDSDPDIDIALGGKPTKSGIKMTVIGQDGSTDAKKKSIMKMIELTRTAGFYAELDLSLAQKLGVSPIKDENIIRKVLDKHKIEMNPDGSYQRLIAGINKVKTKVLVGMPKIK